MPSNALFVHVPVDQVTIMRGPDAVSCARLRNEIAEMRHNEQIKSANKEKDPYRYIDIPLLLQTPASMQVFKRKLHLAEMFGFEDEYFSFTALFCNGIVSGTYNMEMRTGWFSLD